MKRPKIELRPIKIGKRVVTPPDLTFEDPIEKEIPPRLRTRDELWEWEGQIGRSTVTAELWMQTVISDLQKVGADEIIALIRTAYRAGHEPGKLFAMSSLVDLLNPRLKALAAVRRINAGKAVDLSERVLVARLDRELQAEFPKRTPRYREIVARMQALGCAIKVGRVRYIVEGSR